MEQPPTSQSVIIWIPTENWRQENSLTGRNDGGYCHVCFFKRVWNWRCQISLLNIHKSPNRSALTRLWTTGLWSVLTTHQMERTERCSPKVSQTKKLPKERSIFSKTTTELKGRQKAALGVMFVHLLKGNFNAFVVNIPPEWPENSWIRPHLQRFPMCTEFLLPTAWRSR